MPRGQTVKLTPEIQEKICWALRMGNYRSVAADWAGVPRETFERWCEEGKKAKRGRKREFWLAILEAEKASEVRAVTAIVKAAKKNRRAAAWLKSRPEAAELLSGDGHETT